MALYLLLCAIVINSEKKQLKNKVWDLENVKWREIQKSSILVKINVI